MLEKLKSRKLWIGIISVCLPIAVQLVNGEVGWDKACGLAVIAGVTYMVSQAQVDAAEMKAGGGAAMITAIAETEIAEKKPDPVREAFVLGAGDRTSTDTHL